MQVTIFVGETGAGKSSMIRGILQAHSSSAYNTVRVGHGTNSCTDRPQLVGPCGGFGYLLDTMGTNDSGHGVKKTDQEILFESMRMLYERVGSGTLNVRVVWCCKPKQRCSSDLQQQAKFISDIFETANVSNRASAWRSVAIAIQNKSDQKHSDSVVAAACRYGAGSDIASRVFGAKVVEWTPTDGLKPEELEDREILLDPANAGLRKLQGVVSAQDYVNQAEQVVTQMPICSVRFRRQKCTNCGQSGDGRYFQPTCHGSSTRIHPNGRTHGYKRSNSYHRGSTLYRHKGYTQIDYVHSSTEYYHSSSTTRKHRGYAKSNYKYDTETYVAYYNHSHTGAFLHTYKWFLWETWNHRYYWSCCGGSRDSQGCYSEAVWRERQVQKRLNDTCSYCYRDWDCGYYSKCGEYCDSCGELTSTRGCMTRCSKNGCKKALYTTGCTENKRYCNFCKRSPYSTGCESYCSQCSRIFSSSACQTDEFCSDCSMPWGNCYSFNGCKYSCCNQLQTSSGCKTVCSNCHRDFGTYGCLKTTSHNLTNL